MYHKTLAFIGIAAQHKAKLCASRPLAYFIHAGMAGVYLGFGVVLVFVLSTPFFKVQSPVVDLIMSGTFGLALSLVIVAGADLFTGNTMIMPLGWIMGRIKLMDLGRVWFFSYLGNFLGAILLAFLVSRAMILQDATWCLSVATKKMSAPWMELFIKGILCNWLVVLAIWCTYRLRTETAKLIMVWWCLLGFMGSGYEHSIANMSLLTLANLLPHQGYHGISWGGLLHNLIPVTLGNMVSGVLFVGLPYYFIGMQSADSKDEG